MSGRRLSSVLSQTELPDPGSSTPSWAFSLCTCMELCASSMSLELNHFTKAFPLSYMKIQASSKKNSVESTTSQFLSSRCSAACSASVISRTPRTFRSSLRSWECSHSVSCILVLSSTLVKMEQVLHLSGTGQSSRSHSQRSSEIPCSSSSTTTRFQVSSIQSDRKLLLEKCSLQPISLHPYFSPLRDSSPSWSSLDYQINVAMVSILVKLRSFLPRTSKTFHSSAKSANSILF